MKHKHPKFLTLYTICAYKFYDHPPPKFSGSASDDRSKLMHFLAKITLF